MNHRNLAENPLVSIVIPVFNGEKYIQDCLKSVYSQTYCPIEVVIVDDGSTDRSMEMITGIEGEKKILQQNHSDVSQSRNTGVHNSTGELIAFLDQDDLWLSDKLEKQVQPFIQNPAIDLVFTDLMKFNEQGQKRHPKDRHRYASKLNDRNQFEMLVRKNVLMPSAVMVRKDSFMKAGMFDSEFLTCGDYELWLRMASLGMKFYYLPKALTLYRQHGKNTSKKIEIMNEDRIRAVKKTFSNSQLSSIQMKLKPMALASAYLEAAHSYFSIKEYNKFLEYARWALTYDKRIVKWRFIRRYLRSWFYVRLGKN